MITFKIERLGKRFYEKATRLFWELALSTILGFVVVYNGMNGSFFRRKMKRPYIHLWRMFTWSAFIYVVFTYVGVPFFAWWDKVVLFINHIIWG